MLDYEIKLVEIIQEYKAGDKHRWSAAFAIRELWESFPTRHGEIMAVLVNELSITDDQIYNLCHAAELANDLPESIRKLTETLSPSHFARLYRAAGKYRLSQETVEEYLETAAEHGISAQALIEQVMEAHDPDEKYLFHRALRGAARACRRLLEVADYNGLEARAKEAARLLLDILEDLK